MKIKYSRLDRDLKRGLYLDFKLEVEAAENGYVIEIIDEDSNLVYTTNEPVKTGDFLYDTAYMQKDYFKSMTTTFKMRKRSITTNVTTNLSAIITCNTFKVNIDNVEVKPIFGNDDTVTLYKTYIRWTYDNFSLKDLYIRSLLYPIMDDNKDVSYDILDTFNPSKIIKSSATKISARDISIQQVTVINISPSQLFVDNNNLLKTSIILYRLSIEDTSSNIKYFPEKGAFRYKASNVNEAPVIKLQNINVVKKGDSFQLKLESVLRDSNLDDIRYTITDNQGNTIFQEDYYSYTPRIDNIIFDYNTYNFNSLFLRLNAEISDNLNYTYRRSFSHPLFKVTNLRMRRDRLVWDVLNYSNNALKTTVEILDMSNKVVYTGNTMINRLEKDPIAVTDDKVITLLTELDPEEFYQYYKFRIKVRCDDENYTGYVEFKNGTLVSTQHHYSPDIEIFEGIYPSDYYDRDKQGKEYDYLERDDENNKRIRLLFDINPADGSAVGDYCKYTVSDDSGNVLYTSKDNIVLPQRVELYVPYDFTKKIYNILTVKAVNEYGNNSSKTVEIPSYYIKNARVIEGSQKITFEADNYFEGDIAISAEIHYNENFGKWVVNPDTGLSEFIDPTDISIVRNSPMLKEQEFILRPTEKTTRHYIRVIPKIYYNNDGIKCGLKSLKPILRVDGYSKDDSVKYSDKYLKVENFIEPKINEKPAIMINYSNNEFDSIRNTIKSILNITFSDPDGDWINYDISDRYDVIEKKEFFDLGISNSYTTTVSKVYDLNTINSSLIQWNLLAYDEEGLYDNIVHKIPLHYISNLIFENNNFQYKCKLFSNKPIITRLEILDDEGYLYGRGKEVTVNYLEDTKLIEEAISIKKFKPGNYRYRIKVYSPGENWSQYYPNLNGEVVNISKAMIDADRTIPNSTLTTEEISSYILDELTEVTSILGEKIKIGSYSSDKTTILGRLYDTMQSLTDPDNRRAKVAELLDIFSNHHDSLKVVFNGTYGNYLLKSTFEDNGVTLEASKGYTNYAMDMNNFTYNIDGYPLEFKIKDNSHLSFEKYQPKAFINGRKLLDHQLNAQILNDGLSKVYLGTDNVDDFSLVEIETHKNILDHAESDILEYKITSLSDIEIFRNIGKSFEVAQYYLNNDIIPYVIRNNNRINLFRYVIRKDNGNLTVMIKDSLYMNDVIKIVTNTVTDRQYLNSDSLAGGSSASARTIKPTYFVPLMFIDSAGNLIDMTTTTGNNLDVYINGLVAVPNEDYVVIPKNDELNLPSMVLFKDLLFNNSDIEIFYRPYDKENSESFTNALSVNNGYYYFDGSSLDYPLIKGMFSVYSNNKKIPSEDVIVLNKKYLVFKKNQYTTRVPENFYIKVNYPDNPIVNRLLQLYTDSPNDTASVDTLINALSIENKNSLLKTTNKYTSDDVKLTFLKYVYDLDNSEEFQFLKEIKDRMATFKSTGFDCSNRNLFDKDVKSKPIEVPKYFNHNINIFASSSLFDNNNFEDNISIYNPSRLLQITSLLSNYGNIIDCSMNSDKNSYDIFLNEGIDIEMDYIVKDIEIERNK